MSTDVFRVSILSLFVKTGGLLHPLVGGLGLPGNAVEVQQQQQ